MDATEVPDDVQGEAGEPKPVRVTHFAFAAKVFQVPGAHFVLVSQGQGKPKKAMFGVEMGAGEAMISLKHLRDNFGIPAGSSDDQLIERAEAGLHYVPDIRPGDAIPNELLDGTASWTVSRRHKRVARERIQVQLLAWVSGEAADASDLSTTTLIINDPESKKKLREAFQKAAVQLGMQAEDSEKVVDRIETLARELCYIEALRDRFQQVSRIKRMLDTLIKAYNNDLRAVDEINRCKVLMADGWREIHQPLEAIDAEITDIMNALQTIDEVIAAIRRARDDIHFIMMQWDPVIALWQATAPIKGKKTDKALEALYRLLATRFSTGRSMLGNVRRE